MKRVVVAVAAAWVALLVYIGQRAWLQLDRATRHRTVWP